MTYQEALAYLDSFIDYEKAPSSGAQRAIKLERMVWVAEALGNPQSAVPSIHIAGTKGKGSTAAMVASILRQGGFSVGLYTSPHLVTIRERIRVNDELIGEEEMACLVERVKRVADSLRGDERPSFFELYTALAFLYFKERRADFAVYEVGMGGRLDATNVVRPLVSAVTPVSYDHTAVLGGRLSEIASEKAGIIKDGGTCVVSAQEPEALAVIESVASKRRARLYRVGRDILVEEVPAATLTEMCDIRGIFGKYPSCEIGLLGAHQALNAATAVGVVECLRFSGTVVPERAMREGLRRVRWPGRLEIVGSHPRIVLDGAHNRASAAALAQAVRDRFRFKRLFLILGVSKDKDIKGIVEELEPIASRIVITKSCITERAEEPQRIKDFVKEKETVVTKDLGEALGRATDDAAADDLIVITGSLFLVGEAKALFEGKLRSP